MNHENFETKAPEYLAQLKPQHLRQLPELDRLRTLGIMAAIVFRSDTTYDRASETYAKDLCAAAEIAADLLRLVEAKESFYVVPLEESDVGEMLPEKTADELLRPKATREQIDTQLANRTSRNTPQNRIPGSN